MIKVRLEVACLVSTAHCTVIMTELQYPSEYPAGIVPTCNLSFRRQDRGSLEQTGRLDRLNP